MFGFALLLFNQVNCMMVYADRRRFRLSLPVGKKGFARKGFFKVTSYVPMENFTCALVYL